MPNSNAHPGAPVGPRAVVAILLILAAASPPAGVLAQSAPAARGKPAAPAPCTAPEYREFDFWIGDWASYDTKGVLQGYNRVEKILSGCVLQEYWLGTDGAVGTSFSLYDLTRKVWNQTWVSNHGTLLPIEGYRVGPSMVLIGPHLDSTGRAVLHRTIWTPTPDGVHQVWDCSSDGGRTWDVNYEGYLRRTTKFPTIPKQLMTPPAAGQ